MAETRMAELSMIDRFYAARRVGTPLIAISTPDPAATIERLIASTNEAAANREDKTVPPILRFDGVRGLTPANEAGVQALTALRGTGVMPTKLHLIFNHLLTMKEAPSGNRRAGAAAPPPEILIGQRTLLIVSNAHRFLEGGGEAAAVSQALWNLRDVFKAFGCCVVLLAPEFKIPSELKHDVLMLEEPLPDTDELGEIVRKEMKTFRLPRLSDEDEAKAVDAVRGLSAFEADQTMAMCITRQGVNFAELRERKRLALESINNGKGVKFYRGGEHFDEVLGLDAAKEDVFGIFHGRRAPRMIVTLEEFGKTMSGTSDAMGKGGDSNGIQDDFAAVLLGAMEDYDWPGWIFYGQPGTGKTLIPKAAGRTFDVENAKVDLNALQGSKVGESGSAIREMIKKFYAMAGPGGLVVMANANELGNISAEIRRRFRLGIYMFDLPSQAQLKPMWDHYCEKLGITESQREVPVNDDGYVPANVRDVCDLAERRQITLVEAAKRIIPVKVSAPETIILRQEFAHGRLLDANRGGVYLAPGITDPIVPNAALTGRLVDGPALFDFRKTATC